MRNPFHLPRVFPLHRAYILWQKKNPIYFSPTLTPHSPPPTRNQKCLLIFKTFVTNQNKFDSAWPNDSKRKRSLIKFWCWIKNGRKLNLNMINKREKALNEKSIRKKDTEEPTLLQENKSLSEQLSQLKLKAESLLHQRDQKVAEVGNHIHPSVPTSRDEKENLVIRSWGEIADTKQLLTHDKMLLQLDGIESKQALLLAGHRGYFPNSRAYLIIYRPPPSSLCLLFIEIKRFPLYQFDMRESVLAFEKRLERQAKMCGESFVCINLRKWSSSF